MLPEGKYNNLARLKFLARRLRSLIFKSDKIEQRFDEVLTEFSRAKADVLGYFNIAEAEYWDLLKRWPEIESRLFLSKKDASEFYLSWSGDYAKANICANVFNQFLSHDIYHTAKKYIPRSGNILDFGCGTASISIALANQLSGNYHFVVSDLQNDIGDFVTYRAKRNARKSIQWISIFDLDRCSNFDFVMCIDVLEHLENSAEVFCTQLMPKVSVGGLLFLRAPWRGQLTHIDEAADCFYRDGGRKMLSKCFREVCRVGSNDIDAIYRRIR